MKRRRTMVAAVAVIAGIGSDESKSKARRQKALKREGFHIYYHFQTLLQCFLRIFQSLLHFPNYIATLQKQSQAPKFFDAKSQFAMFQNASMNFGRALR